jgi:hypothetical protein
MKRGQKNRRPENFSDFFMTRKGAKSYFKELTKVTDYKKDGLPKRLPHVNGVAL